MENTENIEIETRGVDADVPAQENDTDALDTAALDAEFSALIRGKYHDAFNRRVKKILVKRFRENSRQSEAGVPQATDVQQSAETVEQPVGNANESAAPPQSARVTSHTDDAEFQAAVSAEVERFKRELIAAGRLSETARGSGVARPLGVERLTLAEREALERRALKGEKIVL